MINKFNFFKKIICIFLIMILYTAASARPVVQESKIMDFSNMLEENESLNSDFAFVSNFFDKALQNKQNSFDNINKNLEKYLDNNKIGLPINLLNILFEKTSKGVNNVCKEENLFLNVLDQSLVYANENNITLFEVYLLLKQKIGTIRNGCIGVYSDIEKAMNEEITYNNISVESKQLLLSLNNQSSDSQTYGTVEEYWAELGRAKGYWHGFYPAGLNDEPTKNMRNLLWYAPDFYNWFYNAAEYLYGAQGIQWRNFEGINMVFGGLFIVFLILTMFAFSLGVMTMEAFFFALGVVPGLFAPLIGIILLYYDYVALTYFLYGTNSFLRLLDVEFIDLVEFQPGWDSGEVNIMVFVHDNLGKGIPDCLVQVANTELINLTYSSQGNPIEWGNWVNDKSLYQTDVVRPGEFRYVLKQITLTEKTGYYTLYDRDKPKYTAAVPPPGIYSINVTIPTGKFVKVSPLDIPEAETHKTIFVDVTIT